jgi:hypothetical protein
MGDTTPPKRLYPSDLGFSPQVHVGAAILGFAFASRRPKVTFACTSPRNVVAAAVTHQGARIDTVVLPLRAVGQLWRGMPFDSDPSGQYVHESVGGDHLVIEGEGTVPMVGVPLHFPPQQ